MVAVLEPDVLGLGAGLEHLRTAAELEVFDEGDGIAVGEDVAVGIFDDPGGLGRGILGPFVAAGRALPVVGMAEGVFESAGRTGGMGHFRGGV